MVHASLFSGIGGPEVAAEMMGWENAFHCEINPFGRAVLEYWFPNSVSYEDITKTSFKEWRGRIDVLTGGFPCQPFSYAGKRGGREDDRYLWPEMLRAIDEIRPAWVVGENVAGITTMVEGGLLFDLGGEAALFGEGDGLHRYTLRQSFTIERICRDLEHLGYSVQPLLVPACAVGAPHRRDRVFIVANVADTDGGNDRGIPGGYEGAGREDRVPERDEVRVAGLASEVRPQVRRTATDTASDGRDGRTVNNGEKRCPCRNAERSTEGGSNGVGLRGEPRIYGEQRDAPDTDGGRCSPQGTGEGVKGCRCHDALAGERGFKAERTDGLSGLHRRDPGERWRNFPSVSPIHRGNDGLPFDVDNLTIPFAKWRTESLKAYGNAIVPQVMYEIFLAIEQSTNPR